MVDDSSAPIVLLDFDGVLNAFPDAIDVRYEDVGVAPVVECRGRMTDDFGPERAFRLDGVETVRLGRRGGTWHLHWSRELAANLYGLAESGVIDLRWLSTWQPYVHILDGLLGWDPDVVHNTHWYDPLTGRGRMGGKLHAVVDEVIRRRTSFDLKKAQERAHILEGLKKATDIVDELIATIRACKGGMAEAKAAIMERFGFDDPQADAIVKLQLGRLAGLEILKIEEELAGLRAKIEDWQAVLADDSRVLAIVKEELLEIRRRFADPRRTEIETVTGEVDIEDLIAEEQCVYTLTEAGYVKRQPKAIYQAQHRGGRGILGLTRKEEDIVQEMFVGSTHDYVLFVTNRGRLFQLKGYTIPEGSRTSKGAHIVNLLQLAEGEKVTNMLRQSTKDTAEGGYVTMVTRQGLIKRTPLSQYANIRKSGLIAIALNEGDSIAWTRLTTGNDTLIVATRNGQAIRFYESDARPMGRGGHGVRAIRLEEGDQVVGVSICREGATVLTVTEHGKGRRSQIEDYRLTGRGGKGVRNYDVSKDKVAGIKIVDDTDDVLLSSQEGVIIRMHAADITIQSRYGGGVRVMRLGDTDCVTVVARTDHDDEAETAKPEQEAGDAEPTAEEVAALEAAEQAEQDVQTTPDEE